MTASQRNFTVDATTETATYRLYLTPAGRYTAVHHLGVWVLTTPGLEVGRYDDIDAAEVALDADVTKRMCA